MFDLFDFTSVAFSLVFLVFFGIVMFVRRMQFIY